eukprot:2242851-Rhodomonas_salina.1
MGIGSAVTLDSLILQRVLEKWWVAFALEGGKVLAQLLRAQDMSMQTTLSPVACGREIQRDWGCPLHLARHTTNSMRATDGLFSALASQFCGNFQVGKLIRSSYFSTHLNCTTRRTAPARLKSRYPHWQAGPEARAAQRLPASLTGTVTVHGDQWPAR